MSYFEPSDRVFSLRYGPGTVQPLQTTNRFGIKYPITIIFDTSEQDAYTADGKLHTDNKFADLYHGIPQIIAPPEPVRLPPLTIDAPILVRNTNIVHENWYPRHFSSWSKYNKVICFPDGKTSWSTKIQTPVFWDEWKLPTDTPTSDHTPTLPGDPE